MHAFMSSSIADILDPEQLKRIEATHRGFFYQHLYAVGCLFLAQNAEVIEILVETDEDIELLLENRHVYIQVKTRSSPLVMSDISGTLSRFDEIRDFHTLGQRKGTPDFFVISSVNLGPELSKMTASVTWPPDVTLLTPTHILESVELVPPAWSSLVEGLHWCFDKAKSLPFRRLDPETLVWKLAARVQFACTGTPSGEQHRFLTAGLPELFDQIAIQLQRIPEIPIPYRLQENEPIYETASDVRLIVGFSGSGKTAWAAQVAKHSEKTVVYFDIGDVNSENLASSLVGELVGRYLSDNSVEFNSIALPGATGLDSLRALDQVLLTNGDRVLVMIDNVHRVLPDQLRSIVQAAPHIQYILLSQPSSTQHELEALLSVEAESLDGWSIETVGEEFYSRGCPIDPSTGFRVRQLTGGLPLFVRDAAQLCETYYGCDATQFCEAIS